MDPSKVAYPPEIVGEYSIDLDRAKIAENPHSILLLVEHKISKEQRALKIVDKRCSSGSWKRELKALTQLNHKHIVRLHNTYENKDYGFLILDYYPQGDLFNAVIASGCFPEVLAKKIAGQIVSALEYCHSNFFVHGDLKPENVCIKEGNAHLIDFGFSRKIHKSGTSKAIFGSSLYCAPEVYFGTPYNPISADIWSLGVLISVMTMGFFPWNLPQDFDLNDLCVDYTKPWNLNITRTVHRSFTSASFKELIQRMLDLDPQKRPSLQEIKNHPWLALKSTAFKSEDIGCQPIRRRDQDSETVGVLAAILNLNKDFVRKQLKDCKDTQLYFMYIQLLKRHKKIVQ